MNIRFSPEAARREMTPVDNLFFLQYMPDADGMFVKVYLYGLMQCYHSSLADADVAEALGIPETQVRCAFVYWQAKGLVRILGDDPLTVEYLLTEQPAVTTATPKKYRRFIESLNALLAPRTLELREMKAMYDCIELYGLEEGAVLALVSYCMDVKGRRVSANYILSVAQTWNEEGITTQAQADEYVANYRLKKHGAVEVLRRWNKTRPPTVDEMTLYDRWIGEWGFDAETILSVCAGMTDVSTPNFSVLNDRLERLHEQNVTSAADYAGLIEQDSQNSAFAKRVFARLGKIGNPKKADVFQLTMFRDEKQISEEAILLAADTCVDAERPFGLLKKILSDWAEQGVHTADDAKKLAEAPKHAPRRKKKNAALIYAQTPISEQDFNDLIVDLNEEL